MTVLNAFTSEQHELVNMLRDNLADLAAASDPLYIVKKVDDNENLGLQQPYSDINLSLLKDFRSHCDNIGKAAAMIGLSGFSCCCQRLALNFSLLLERTDLIDGDQLFLIENWVIYVGAYLEVLEVSEHANVAANDFVEFLCEQHWPKPFSTQEAQEVLQSFLTSVVIYEASDSDMPATIDVDMLSLAIDTDVRPELLDGLLLELPGQIQEFTQSVSAYLLNNDKSILSSAQRVAHTIKGAANVVNIRAMANLMHFAEEIFEIIGKTDIELTQDFSSSLVNVCDCVEAIAEYLLGGDEYPQDIGSVMQSLLDWSQYLKTGIRPSHSDPVPTQSTPEQQNDVAVLVPDNLAPQLRVPEQLINDMLQLAGQSAINNSRFIVKVDTLREDLSAAAENNRRLRAVTDSLEHLIEMQTAFGVNNTVVDSGELDPLELERYNELHSFAHQLQELIGDAYEQGVKVRREFDSLRSGLIDQERLNKEEQQLLLQTRLVLVSKLRSRFHRCVRQASKLTAKSAELFIIGDDVLMDNGVLNELVAPLLHLLRNAVDHGIESHDFRVKSGKPVQGQLTLEFARQGQSIIIYCRDDGPGLDLYKIKQRAVELGLLGATEEVSDHALQQLILQPAFSTSARVSQTSGRGIGLDVVNTAISKLNGKLTIKSIETQGTTFEISLPVTLLSTQAFLVQTTTGTMAVVSRGIDQLVFVEAKEITQRAEQSFFNASHEDSEEIPVYFFDELLQGRRSQRALDNVHMPLLIAQAPNGKPCGVIINSVSASINVVVKPLNQFTYKSAGIIGATMGGDGCIYPVIDLVSLLDVVIIDGKIAQQTKSDSRNTQPGLQEPVARVMALVVDDSLSARRSLAQFVTDLGMDVCTAKDGIEAISLINQHEPSLVLVDLEMPRMNGLELTEYIRTRESSKSVPVIMITSRTTQKHRELAFTAGVNCYLNKPFSEDELLNTIMTQMEG